MKLAKDRKLTEFEVQAEAMELLRDVLGNRFIIRGEYAYQNCRFDLAIFDANTRNLICTIELKQKTNRPGRNLQTRRQIRKYESVTGKPCILLHEGNLYQAVRRLKDRFLQKERESQI